LLWWFFDEGGLAAGVEKQISPLRFAPVEMTAFFVGLRAWLKEVDGSRLRAKAKSKSKSKDKGKSKSKGESKSRSSASGEG